MRILLMVFRDISRHADHTHNKELLRCLGQRNEVHLFAFANRKTDIKFHHLGKLYLNYNILQPFYIFTSLIKMIFSARKYAKEADIIYSRDIIASIAAILIKKLWNRNLRILSEINDLESDTQRNRQGALPKIYSKIFYLAEHFTIRQFDAITTVTDGLKRIISISYGIEEKKILSIRNGANINIFKSMNTSEMRKKLDLDLNSYYVGFMGTLGYWIATDELIKILPLVLDRVQNIKFLIVGDGPLKNGLMQEVEAMGLMDYFYFIGNVPYAEVPTYINACDVCLLLNKPYILGTAPLKLYEYMACQMPVVATNSPGLQVLKENNIIATVELEDNVGFADVVIDLIQNEERRNRMGVKARRYVKENHTWESVSDSVEKICKVVLERGCIANDW